MSGEAALLGLLAAIRDEHDRFATGPGKAPQVLPVAHDAIGGDWDVLETAFKRFEGQIVRLGPDSSGSIPGQPGAALLETVKASCAAANTEIEVAAESGMVHASTVGDPDQVNDSLQVMRALVALILSSSLSESPLAAVVVPFGLLDEAHQRLAWDILVTQAPKRLSGQIGTFVPIIDGEAQLKRHCAGDPSLRFAISRASFHKRLRQSPAGKAIEEICPSLDSPLVLFVAAGASASAKVPTGDTMRDEALTRMLPEQTPRSQLADGFRAQLFERKRFLGGEEADLGPDQFARSLTMERVLREEFHQLKNDQTRADSATIKSLRAHCDRALDRDPEGRRALGEIISLHPRLVVVTVNLDWQIEDGLDDDVVVYRRADDFDDATEHVASRISGDPPDPRTPILKIHGSIEDPDSMVVDVEALDMGLDRRVEDALAAIFESSDGPVPWLWVGSSMRDRDVNQFLKKGYELDEWWCDVLPGPGLDDYVTNLRGGKDPTIGGRLITELADEFLPKLATRMRTLSGAG